MDSYHSREGGEERGKEKKKGKGRKGKGRWTRRRQLGLVGNHMRITPPICP